MLELFAYICGLVSILVMGYLIFGRQDLAKFISVKAIGHIEKNLKGLDQVIVLAHIVEKPDSTLADAVLDNLKEGVQYLFLVSKSQAEQELNSYFVLFEALGRIAVKDRNIAAEAVKIKNLPYDWFDVPYIFYRYRDELGGVTKVEGFRGTDKGMGISTFYERLPRSQAQSLCSALLETAPQEIRIQLQAVSKNGKVETLAKTIAVGNDAA